MHHHLQDEVRSSLARDPRIPSAQEIAVSDGDGIITLRGTVATFGQRRAAVQDACKVHGVDEVFDELEVRLLGGDQRDDDEIRGVALQTLIWDADVDAGSLDVKVKDGWLTLTGDVKFQFQSDAAYEDVASLRGVVGITNEIRVNAP